MSAKEPCESFGHSIVPIGVRRESSTYIQADWCLRCGRKWERRIDVQANGLDVVIGDWELIAD